MAAILPLAHLLTPKPPSRPSVHPTPAIVKLHRSRWFLSRRFSAKMEEGAVEKNKTSKAEEIVREIEWPHFPKVLEITGVVIALIATSAAALLALNALLAHFSNLLFASPDSFSSS